MNSAPFLDVFAQYEEIYSGFQDMDPMILAGMGIFILIGALIGLVVVLLFILNISRLLKAIQVQNRKMTPASVFLLLVPIVNIIWIFMVVYKVADSIEAEYNSRSLSVQPRPTFKIGMTMIIAGLAGVIPLLGFIAGPVSFVCMIIYWVKTAEYRKNIVDMGASYDNNSDDSLNGGLAINS